MCDGMMLFILEVHVAAVHIHFLDEGKTVGIPTARPRDGMRLAK
jgi:hypothetical protein